MRKVPATQQPSVIDLTDDENPLDGQDRMEAHLKSDDYFEVLNLPRSASASDVKRAYRKLAVQWHPDKNRSNLHAEGIFKRIGEAYEVLSDPEKRQIYVKYGKAGLNGGVAGADNADGFTRRGHGGFSTQHARDIFDAFFGGQDPFEAFFGQHRGSTQRYGRSEDDVFGSMGFGGMGIGRGFGNMGMPGRGFGNMGMDMFFSDGFGGMAGSGVGFSTSTSSSSSTFTDRNGHVITQKTVTTTGADGRTSTTTQEYRNGTLVNSSSTCDGRLADAGRMQLEGGGLNGSMSYQRRGSRPRY